MSDAVATANVDAAASGARPARPSTAQRAYAERARRGASRRRLVNRIMRGVAGVAVVLALLPLLLIVAWLLLQGAATIDLEFLAGMPAPAGATGGGIANAIVGSVLVVGMGTVLAVPVGIGAGLYLHERARGALGTLVRLVADVLGSVPGIVVGVVAWQLLVRPLGRHSALAGGVALSVIMCPIIVRATEEVLRLVPRPLHEAALALGYPQWRAALRVVAPAAIPGIVTGVLIAVARVAGETAALLFTALGNQFWSVAPDRPIAALPLQIFTYANSPYDTWQRQAAGAALVLLVLVFLLSLTAHTIARRRTPGEGR